MNPQFTNIIKKVAQAIENTEFENNVFVVGGFVRDFVMGNESKDVDFVVLLPNGGIRFAEFLCKHFNVYKEGSNPVVYNRFDTAKFAIDGVELESVMTRRESYEKMNRKPTVEFGSLFDDAMRRDLTINALYLNINTFEIVDPTGHGLNDIKNKILRTTDTPERIFEDDPLRILRVIRFFAKFGFDIPFSLIKEMKRSAKNLEWISKERINVELVKILQSNLAHKALKLCKITGIYDVVFGESGEEVNYELIEKLNGSTYLAKLATLPIKNVKQLLHDLKFTNHEIKAVVETQSALEILTSSGCTPYAIRKIKTLFMKESVDNVVFIYKASGNTFNIDVNSVDRIEMLPVTGDDLIVRFQLQKHELSLYGTMMHHIQEECFENPMLDRKSALEIADTVYVNRNILTV